MTETQDSGKAPPDTRVPRNSLIRTAAVFLSSPSVQGSSEELKTKFLVKKGLTEEEIELAREEAQKIIFNRSNTSGPVANYQPPLPVQGYPPSGSWSFFRDVTRSIILLGVVSYSVHWLVKKYVFPFLYGDTKKKSLDERFTELDEMVNNYMSDIKGSIAKINADISSINEQKSDSVTRQIEELKTEVSSLKKMLLSRKEFTAVTVSGPPSIPSWQMAEAAEDEKHSEEEGNGSGTTGSDSSIEMIKD